MNHSRMCVRMPRPARHHKRSSSSLNPKTKKQPIIKKSKNGGRGTKMQGQAVFDRYGKLVRDRSWRISRTGSKTPITVE